jgi:hypothetical protein
MTAEYRVPVRKASKPIDDRLMGPGVLGPTRISQFLEQSQRARLILRILAVLEGQVDEVLLCIGHIAIMPLADGAARPGARADGSAGERPQDGRLPGHAAG